VATTAQDRAGELLGLVELMRQQIGLRVVDERASPWSTA